jgi:hypothetical protein
MAILFLVAAGPCFFFSFVQRAGQRANGRCCCTMAVCLSHARSAAIPELYHCLDAKAWIRYGQELAPGQSAHCQRARLYHWQRRFLMDFAKCCPGQQRARYTELLQGWKCPRRSVPCQKQSLMDTAGGHWKSINQNSPRESEAIIKRDRSPSPAPRGELYKAQLIVRETGSKATP